MSGAASGEPLRGRRIVLTRPAGQNDRLEALIRAAGGESIVFPAIEIADIDDVGPVEAAADRLHTYDLAVFVSANAVDKAMNVIRARGTWPDALRAAVVGGGSERALRRHGVNAVVAPTTRFDSEALLELPALTEVAGKKVVIFRGEGGRELLGETLCKRGANVDYVTCYRRMRPNADAAPLLNAWQRGEIDAVTVTSSEGLRYLFDMVGAFGQASLRRTPLFAPHARIAANARGLGCERVVETAPGDDGIVAGLTTFWATMEPDRPT